MLLLVGLILGTGCANHVGYGPAVTGCQEVCSGRLSGSHMFPRSGSNFRQEVHSPTPYNRKCIEKREPSQLNESSQIVRMAEHGGES